MNKVNPDREIGFGSVALAVAMRLRCGAKCEMRCEAVWARARASPPQVIFPGPGYFRSNVLPRVVPRRGAHHFAFSGGWEFSPRNPIKTK